MLLDFTASTVLVSLTPTKELALPLFHVYPQTNLLASTQLANICMESESLALPTLSVIPETATPILQCVSEWVTINLAQFLQMECLIATLDSIVLLVLIQLAKTLLPLVQFVKAKHVLLETFVMQVHGQIIQ